MDKQTKRLEKPGVLPKPKRVLKIRPLNNFDREGSQAGTQKEKKRNDNFDHIYYMVLNSQQESKTKYLNDCYDF